MKSFFGNAKNGLQQAKEKFNEVKDKIRTDSMSKS